MGNHEHQIQLVVTGGTIDSFYDTDKCTTVCHSSTAIPAFLTQFAAMSEDDYQLCTICLKDSRAMTEQDLQATCDAIMRSTCSSHIVTHGTFTLFSNARKLMAMLPKQHGQTVIFTGAMWPLVGFSPNDAGFNLGSAFIAARLAAPGVYIAFNGQLYLPTDQTDLH